MPAYRPWLLGLSDLVLGSAPQSRGLGYDWTEAIQASIDLTKEVAPVVAASVKAGGKKKHAGSSKQRAEVPPPPPEPAPSSVPPWAIPAALGTVAVVGVVLLTRRRPAPSPVPAPARNPRRRSRHAR